MVKARQRFADVAVVCITKNEEGAIAKVISDVQSHVPGAHLLVVDGSEDRTPEIAQAAGAEVQSEPGGGFGPALHQAILAPKHSIIVTIDADDTYPAEVIPELVHMVESGCSVAGTDRIWRGPPKNMPLLNWLANLAFSVLASLRAGRWIRDPHSGMRAYRRDLIQEISWDFDGLAFPVDLILWPVLRGVVYREVGIDYRIRVGDSKLERLPSAVATLKRIFRSKRRAAE